MRRKDYEVVGAAVSGLALAPSDYEAVVAALCAAFAQENPRFDPAIFRAAASRDASATGAVDPETLTRILIDYLVASASSDDLPTLSSIVDVAKESALPAERAAGGESS